VQHHGKQLSFNNYLDLHAAWELVREFDETACAIIKHNNPCGAALASTPVEAYEKALSCDPVSAFGSIVAFNRRVDLETAKQVNQLFVEAVIAPGYDQEAQTLLSTKKSLRIMEMELGETGLSKPHSGFDLKRISGGVLVQDRDSFYVTEKDLKVVTQRSPEKAELSDLLFAWVVCKHVKSNAIVFVKEGKTVGIGAGQMSRVDSVRIAAEKAQSKSQGGVMASDAFFPFRDGLDAAAASGIRAVIQPGGSVRDAEVVQAADEHDIAMVLTGVRHFRH
jgi:phosphoribosylaminoimidazolecarboxamide formyltransferase/IMP cyclohydrolase